MVIRHAASSLLAATLLAGIAVPGCRNSCRRCNDAQPVDGCRYEPYAGGWSEGPVIVPAPAAAGTRTSFPSTERAGGIPVPQNQPTVTYRKATLLERVRFRLRRWNPFRRQDSPSIESATSPQSLSTIRPVPQSRLPYTPAPPVDASADLDRQATTSSPKKPQRDFEPARINVGTARRAAATLATVNVDHWPYVSTNAGAASAMEGAPAFGEPPRFFMGNAADQSIPLSTTAPVQRVRVRNFQ